MPPKHPGRKKGNGFGLGLERVYIYMEPNKKEIMMEKASSKKKSLNTLFRELVDEYIQDEHKSGEPFEK